MAQRTEEGSHSNDTKPYFHTHELGMSPMLLDIMNSNTLTTYCAQGCQLNIVEFISYATQ